MPIDRGRIIDCNFAAYPEVQGEVNTMKTLSSWGSINWALDGIAAPMQDKTFEAV